VSVSSESRQARELARLTRRETFQARPTPPRKVACSQCGACAIRVDVRTEKVVISCRACGYAVSSKDPAPRKPRFAVLAPRAT
jgi:hypothetical protein